MHADWINIPAQDHWNISAGQTVISVLDGTGLLGITGPDSSKFLQGQLTCNMQDITSVASRPGAHCTHKGRMVASFRLLQQHDGAYLFVLPQETLGGLQKSLGKYIVFSKAKLRDASDDYLLLGISGNDAATRVSALFGAAPSALHAQQAHDCGIAVCVNASAPRFLCLLQREQAQAAWQQLAAGNNTVVTDSHYWRLLDIRDGIGEVHAQTIEEFIPQMLNLQVLDGISFTKGCYTGQEIVARMQYRGILKKAMYRISGEGSLPAPNDAILQAGHEQAVGHLVIAEMSGAGLWEGLAVIQHDAIAAPLQLAGGSALQVLALPYTVPVGDKS